MKVGIFTTAIEEAALTLINEVDQAIRLGEIPDTETVFVFSSREFGENPTTDAILREIEKKPFPLFTLSARQFLSDLRHEARKAEKKGDLSLTNEWRNRYGEEVLKIIPPTDLDLLLGYMWIWGENLCAERNGINLHPALPGGPKGEWYKVIWELIKEGQNETGVMMHKVTPELDEGPPVAYCRFPIRGPKFDPLWDKLPSERGVLEELVQQQLSEKEKTNYPLHGKIREHGFMREIPLIIWTVRAFAEGLVRIENGLVLDRDGNKLVVGYDLTPEIDREIRAQLEGNMSNRIERI